MNEQATSGSPPPQAAAKARRALVVANPRKRDQPTFRLGMARLAATGFSFREVDEAGLAATEAAGLAAGCDLAIVSGGDGTLHRAAPLLLAAGLPVGILPTGTANDLARTLAIPADPDLAANIIERGRTTPIDLGEANGHPFFNVASVGMSVDLTRRLTGDRKRRWGKAAYALTAAQVALAARPFRASIHTESGACFVRTLQIAVGNGRFYGGGFAVDERASIDDEALHLYSLEMASAWRMLPMLWALRTGAHGRWASVRALTGSRFDVITARPRSVSADGEIITATPCTFRILPKALRMLVP